MYLITGDNWSGHQVLSDYTVVQTNKFSGLFLPQRQVGSLNGRIHRVLTNSRVTTKVKRQFFSLLEEMGSGDKDKKATFYNQMTLTRQSCEKSV